jgi:NDP-sugar pyrophosphorylase family protein
MQAIILAAGESSRCWPLNHRHKSQVRIFGKPLIYWTIKGLVEKDIRDIIIITRPDSKLDNELGPLAGELNAKLSFVVQEKPLGTGDAIYHASDLVREPFFIFWPYKIQSHKIAEKILEEYGKGKPQAVLVGTKTATPWDYGVLRTEGGRAVEIIEKPEPGREPSDIKVVGAYFLNPDFFEYYEKLKRRHPQDFVDALNFYIKDKPAKFIVLEEEPPALKYPWELLGLLKTSLEMRGNKRYISPSASIAENTVIKGSVHIEDDVIVGENTVIYGPCYIGKNCKIGANNVLRGPVALEEDVLTGAFTEIKNCLVQKGTHFHSGYFGDSVIGEDCRFGAGFVTANRRIDRGNIKTMVKGKKIDTGLTYFGTIVGNDSSFGIKSGTMPGVLVGSKCQVGPGTLVFENLEDKTVFYTDLKRIKRKKV